MTLSVPPKPDEMEISLFGPGVGECVAVHVGLGEWLIVDSCIDPASRAPVALDYMREIGVNVATAVKQVIVTHWHDDHMRGASRVLDAAVGAKFVCSAALQRDEFKEFVQFSRSLNVKAEESSGVDEFSSILSILRARRAAGARSQSVGPEWARADQLLYRRAGTQQVPDCEIFALSPSSATLSRGLHEIASLLPKIGEPKRAAVSVDPNETALVLCVRFGGALALLGSDLENSTTSGAGWAAVLTTAARPTAPANIFKVPHHGSQNAYHGDVWRNALVASPVAVLTPFAKGRKTLPSQDDLARMKQHTRHLYCTAPPPGRATVSDPMVQRTVREVARDFRSRGARMGHVRVRLSASPSAPTVELFGAALAA
jgi:beta-lactamase superfamily II metal-dependent hydrolase